ncbi:MAG: sigma-54 dependent transcriptional regulator [Alphaproteobacteria bacterium]|nr:sigma-54 dependent transcriptional regulator [Alphaproteobacteria bacterium]
MRLLIVGSLNGQIGTASKIAIGRGAKVAHADDIDGALEALRAGQGADLLMIDDKLDIGRIISSLASERISIPVVACGLGNDTKAAVGAIKSGAQEYIPLPPDPELIAAVLEAVTEESNSIVYEDPAMGETLRLAEQVAATDASVLITGESGTGKELLARHLHAKSGRAKNKFISVNCAAIPDNLLESELFGHEKGAFTGAVARRIGKFEEANGGTLLLDEISEMDPRLQAKLLRAIQEREIDRVGGTAPIPVDIRLIATSNRNLEKAVADGDFREDLYFRLNVVNVRIPALRDRPRDIPLLARYFVNKYAELNGVLARPLSEAGLEKLCAHGWRGNVRELENAMHRSVLLATGEEITPEAIILSFDGPEFADETVDPDAAGAAEGVVADTSALVGRTVAEVERDLILETLHHCFGNRTHAANILGISIRTLRNKLKQYSEDGISVPTPREMDRASL